MVVWLSGWIVSRLLAKRDNIRDVIAFPKTRYGIMTEAPSTVADKQLLDLDLLIAKRFRRRQDNFV